MYANAMVLVLALVGLTLAALSILVGLLYLFAGTRMRSMLVARATRYFSIRKEREEERMIRVAEEIAWRGATLRGFTPNGALDMCVYPLLGGKVWVCLLTYDQPVED